MHGYDFVIRRVGHIQAAGVRAESNTRFLFKEIGVQGRFVMGLGFVVFERVLVHGLVSRIWEDATMALMVILLNR